jgi:hypothetical protein
MRRRTLEIMKSGAFAQLGSEGRLAAIYVLQMADWTTCEATVSTHLAAKTMCVRQNTIHRGLGQMVSEGILTVVRPGSPRKAARYRLELRPRSVVAATTTGGRCDHATWSPMTTTRSRSDYVPRRLRLRPVVAATTQCGHHSVSSSDKQSLSLGEQSGGSGSPPTVPCPGGEQGNAT